MRSFVIFCLIFVAFALVQCSPIQPQWGEDDGESDGNFQTGNSQQIEKQKKLISLAKALLGKLKSKGRTDKVEKLMQAIDCANHNFQAFLSINPGREYPFGIKSIIENLKKSQDRLEHLINELSAELDDKH